uniref:Uncharacterized protein n=1 Tax=Lotharella globosa TaxID=91324 RepID=A0A7S4DRJ1_9EUKA|mmetsp:Transcript_5714/g.11346  ORF Transcript_5714/g.11346 Transcript_5714/m.11346 type:complete len:390 (+) Transcript_5714:52-1221(+)|eukprot:CAMPEP_0167793266 /NCGR_PEP_ID=MMETSP0111_2-20121227/13065_1 /TAXON_ID=91324 /ORGANISM="Lotharella globosa, Strain CCCM811" /LENGTH=389 /DNA_ID=CAMNT_0007686365 /DNA_START=53 /DNA_END=1222 /DNA_ORIENTATION=+
MYQSVENKKTEEEAKGDTPSPVFDDEPKKNFLSKVDAFVGKIPAVVLHVVYFAVAIAIIWVLKASIVDNKPMSHLGAFLCNIHMTKLWVTFIGIVFPFFLTLRALVTLETDDDRYWLTYWTVFAFYTLFTIGLEEWFFEDEWLWYAIEGAIYLWLYLPYVHGCTVVNNYFLKPFVLPFVYKISSWLERNFTVAIILGSVVNLAFVSILFIFLLPYCSTYIGVTLVGMVYPFVRSLAVISDACEEDETDEEEAKASGAAANTNGNHGAPKPSKDTQWLTFWFIFAIVHFVDAWYDNLLGNSYWFATLWYKFALPFVVWLQIPMFHGAEYIFLNIICPVFGLHVHRFQYGSVPWGEAPQTFNYISYAKNIPGFVNIVENNNNGDQKEAKTA